MGRGASKASSGAKNASISIRSSESSSMMNNDFANSIYDIPKTMAFPSSASVIKNVPSLRAMKENLDNAKEGAVVSFYLGNTGMEDTVVYEKVGAKSWSVTRLKNNNGNIEQYDGTSKLMGSDLLKSFADKHYRSFDSKAQFTKEYEDAYKKLKRK